MTTTSDALPQAGTLPTEPGSWAELPTFIEVQFPVSKISKESYKERKANNGQTLTGIGKWWGRKPLVLIRATLLGLLLPSTDSPESDRKVFLALMTMDNQGLFKRLRGNLSVADVYRHCTPTEQSQHFDSQVGRVRWKRSTSNGEKQRLQRLAFFRMGYDDRLAHCLRPEEIDGPDQEAWGTINSHLCTTATNIPELVEQLGTRRYGRSPLVADPFCGGGSVPFEAARIGLNAYGSDLNPVAALLTWSAMHILGGGPEVVAEARAVQARAYEEVLAKVKEWGIERNKDGWTADAYIYCHEVLDPVSGWRVPLAPSWVIGEGTRTIVRLLPDAESKSFDFEVIQGASEAEVAQARLEGTWQDGVLCPVDASGRWLKRSERISTSLQQLRGRNPIRTWTKDDVVPTTDDLFKERLFCVRWVDSEGHRHYRSPDKDDLDREERVLELLREAMDGWKDNGCLPSSAVIPGADNLRPLRARGWTYWQHFFNPRQLLTIGLAASVYRNHASHSLVDAVSGLLSVGRAADWNSRLSRWHPNGANEKGEQTVYNAALSTPMVNYSCRPTLAMRTAFDMNIEGIYLPGKATIELKDAREVNVEADIWVTDPGYADSVNYGELSEFFLAWYGQRLIDLFPGWYADSKRALAVEGNQETFRKAMVECYSRFAALMPDKGVQVVMFTHQNAEIWADLALIMWASGLRVSAAWTVGTETDSVGIKQGNRVQGTVLLVLRKRSEDRTGDLSDLYPDLQAEVQSQLESMLALEDKEDPNFSDADYQLAAYAAALRVLTAYSAIDEIDIERELGRPKVRGERSPLVGLIERGVKIASDVLVPAGLDRGVWRNLTPEERFYLKGIEVEAHGDYREGVYQEYARGYGVREYRPLLGSGTANQVRLKTPTEFRARDLGGDGFNGSLLRKVLFAIHKTGEENNPRIGRDYLKSELIDYWERRQLILALIAYLADKPKPDSSMPHWKTDVEAAQLLRGSIENDSI